MNIVIAVLVVSASSYLILRAVRDTKPKRHVPFWEQDARRRQLQREIDDSRPISWQRGR